MTYLDELERNMEGVLKHSENARKLLRLARAGEALMHAGGRIDRDIAAFNRYPKSGRGRIAKESGIVFNSVEELREALAAYRQAQE